MPQSITVITANLFAMQVRGSLGEPGKHLRPIAATEPTLDGILFGLGTEPPGSGCIGIKRVEQAALTAMRQTSLADLAMQSASDLIG